MKRAVIWDLDGTLIDSADYHWRAWQAVMAVENISITYGEYVADFGKRNDEILRGRVSAGKPAPDVFLVAAEKMRVAPESCIVIEDAPAGIEAARRAGMKAVGVLTTHPALDADWVFATLDQIPTDFFAVRGASPYCNHVQ